MGPSNVVSTVRAERWRISSSVPISTSVAGAEDTDPVTKRFDLAQDVRRKEDGLASSPCLVHAATERLLHQRIEPAGRLVEEQQAGSAHERRDEDQLLAVAF